jgi:type IV pilus biogenesis protein PilP
VFGTQNNRQALVREPGGRVVRVKVGDRLDGGRITAITASEVQYQKGNRVLAIAMPRG